MAITVTIPVANDTHMNNSVPTTNYSTAGALQIGESNAGVAVARSILNFDGLTAGSVPSNAIVTGATLSIYANEDLASNARTLSVYRLLRNPVYAEVTWNIYATGGTWNAAGGFGTSDCEQTDIGTLALTATETVNQYKNIPLLTAGVQGIVTGAHAFNHLLLKVDTESDDRYNYDALEATGTNYPTLTVTYELPSGTQTIII